MLLRIQQPKMNVAQMQKALLLTIRAEYEHNLSQQIYVSNEAWELVKATKENLIKLVNLASGNLRPDDSAMELSKRLVDVFASLEHSPIQASINKIKIEAAEIL
jgi:Lon protease-like protein